MKRVCQKSGDELTPLPRGAYKCSACGGMFVPRSLLDRADEQATHDVSVAAGAENHDAQTGRCPNDRGIMTRAEIDLQPDGPVLHLERCGSCQGVWFDAGEWSALAERQLLEHIDEFWTAEWRARQRRDRDAASYERRLREAFGSELYDALYQISHKLKGHERRSQALAFLREVSGE
jgi:Zn-finger nucleic acid-binding protein